uniref:ArfGAP with dual PH domains 2 n=1 Tax=Leptobrachium leishanense TaxID=445787 RepID=A0A8C5QWS0_9ANUR
MYYFFVFVSFLLEADWASCNVGVFICLQCSGVHRISTIDKVKSLRLDNWESDLIEHLRNHGNQKAKEIYEAYVPPFYYRPQAHDCMILKEEWIKAKYERREFQFKTEFYSGDKEGFLWKRGRKKQVFLERKFVYSEKEGLLKYYTSSPIEPKGTIHIRSLNAIFQGENIGHRHSVEITYQNNEGQTRRIFVYHESGKEIVTWFNFLRAARFNYLRGAFPGIPEAELIPKLTRNYAKVGFMEKKGPKARDAFRKRWFMLDAEEKKLFYYSTPLDAAELGKICIGPEIRGYRVSEGTPDEIKKSKWDTGIVLKTPGRDYVFTCENGNEQEEWLEALQRVMSPSAGAANHNGKQ